MRSNGYRSAIYCQGRAMRTDAIELRHLAPLQANLLCLTTMSYIHTQQPCSIPYALALALTSGLEDEGAATMRVVAAGRSVSDWLSCLL